MFLRRCSPYSIFPAELRRADVGTFKHKQIIAIPHSAGIMVNGSACIKSLLTWIPGVSLCALISSYKGTIQTGLGPR